MGQAAVGAADRPGAGRAARAGTWCPLTSCPRLPVHRRPSSPWCIPASPPSTIPGRSSSPQVGPPPPAHTAFLSPVTGAPRPVSAGRCRPDPRHAVALRGRWGWGGPSHGPVPRWGRRPPEGGWVPEFARPGPGRVHGLGREQVPPVPRVVLRVVPRVVLRVVLRVGFPARPNSRGQQPPRHPTPTGHRTRGLCLPLQAPHLLPRRDGGPKAEGWQRRSQTAAPQTLGGGSGTREGRGRKVLFRGGRVLCLWGAYRGAHGCLNPLRLHLGAVCDCANYQPKPNQPPETRRGLGKDPLAAPSRGLCREGWSVPEGWGASAGWR